jgi:uncharacterized protein (TIGR03118 family)
MNVSTRHIALTASMALVTGLAIGAATAARAADSERSHEATVAFVQTNLDSNIAGRAKLTDPNLANAWGLAFAPGSPFWVNDNHSGVSTLYAGDGSIVPLVVTIPPPMGSQSGVISAPTGMIWNATSGFLVPGSTFAAAFIFDTEDGTISAWNFNVNPTSAVIAVDNSASGAVYKGLAFGTNINEHQWESHLRDQFPRRYHRSVR